MSILDIRVNGTETIPVFIYLFWPQQSWCHLPSEPTPSTSPGKQKLFLKFKINLSQLQLDNLIIQT